MNVVFVIKIMFSTNCPNIVLLFSINLQNQQQKKLKFVLKYIHYPIINRNPIWLYCNMYFHSNHNIVWITNIVQYQNDSFYYLCVYCYVTIIKLKFHWQFNLIIYNYCKLNFMSKIFKVLFSNTFFWYFYNNKLNKKTHKYWQYKIKIVQPFETFYPACLKDASLPNTVQYSIAI